jgi:hypothetical protein
MTKNLIRTLRALEGGERVGVDDTQFRGAISAYLTYPLQMKLLRDGWTTVSVMLGRLPW